MAIEGLCCSAYRYSSQGVSPPAPCITSSFMRTGLRPAMTSASAQSVQVSGAVLAAVCRMNWSYKSSGKGKLV